MSLGKQIRIRRKKLGLTLDELAALATITNGALSLIERDYRNPSDRTLSKLAKGLRIPFSDLKSANLDSKDPQKLDQEVRVVFSRLTQATDSDQELLRKHILEIPDPVDVATQVRLELGNPDGPIHPEEAAEELGIKVREDSFEGFEGSLVSVGKRKFILVKAGLSTGRRNFVISHEIGHFKLTGHDDLGYTCKPDEAGSYQCDHSKEKEADQFAAEFLLPVNSVRKTLKGKCSIKMALQLAQEYGASNHATLMRVVDLSSSPCALIVSEAGNRKYFRRSKTFNNFITIREPVRRSSAAGRILSGECTQDVQEGKKAEKKIVPAKLWLEGDNVKRGSKVIEESLFQPAYDRMFTLIRFE